jgi:hypothetical protein
MTPLYHGQWFQLHRSTKDSGVNDTAVPCDLTLESFWLIFKGISIKKSDVGKLY